MDYGTNQSMQRGWRRSHRPNRKRNGERRAKKEIERLEAERRAKEEAERLAPNIRNRISNRFNPYTPADVKAYGEITSVGV